MSELVRVNKTFRNLPTMTRVTTMAELATKRHTMLKKNYKHWKRKKESLKVEVFHRKKVLTLIVKVATSGNPQETPMEVS